MSAGLRVSDNADNAGHVSATAQYPARRRLATLWGLAHAGLRVALLSTQVNVAQPSELEEPSCMMAGRYIVQAVLGEGGMGTIYRVLDSATQTHLALKHLKLSDSAGSEDRVAHFQREYHILKQLAHPRIIRVYDFGFAEGRPYYTMELLDGKDLRELAPLDPTIACSLLRDVASSLALVHSRGLVYRDVSPRNVRCTSDGRAKLLDFGATVPIGVPSHIIGTPAFVAPEALYGQPLDQRSDLYSLGALAYWLLTSNPPYRVHQFGELRDAWRTQPVQPSVLCRAVPEALSALVMSLLSHTPTGRPQHAGEVIDKLSAIGKHEPDHDLGVIRAYLSTPELVGRDDEVLRVRKALVRATRSRGSAFLVRAEPGMGSTRLLDACVLEGKLVGALVARAEAGALARQEFAAVHAAIAQWTDAQAVPETTALRASVTRLSAATAPNRAANSEGLHAQLAAAILRLARERTLLLVVDDAHGIDAASTAVFALLARAAPAHKLVVCASLSASREPRGSTALRMLIDATTPMQLKPWTASQTEALVYSLFGQVANVPLLANRIQRVALGNPRDTMQLAQHLVDSGLVRHQSGVWSLPSKLDEVALPGNLGQAQRRVIDALDDASRSFAAMLALAPDLDDLALADYARLSPDALALLDELTLRGVLVERAARFSFRHGGFAEVLSQGLEREQRGALHLCLASMHEAAGHHPLMIAYHLHHAGQVEGCLRWVLPWLARAYVQSMSASQAELLEAIVSESGRYRLSLLERHRIRAVMVQYAAIIDPDYGRHAEASFEQLRHDTGLSYWDEYPELDPAARIGQCLARAQAEYEATPEAKRCFAPIEAVRELAVLVRSMTSVYARTLASDKLLELAQWLAPLCSLAPVIQLLYELTQTTADRAVREKRVAHRYLDFAARFEQPLEGVDAVVRRHAAAICTYCAALDEAKQGKASALKRIEPLESLDSFAALAWHVRMLSYIYSGHTAQAARCRESMELLVIEHDQPITLLAMSVLYEAWGYELCEDLTGLKRALELVEEEARRYPGWRPWSVLYGGDVNRLRGDLDAALKCYEQAAAMTAPGKHQVWPHAAERRVVVLCQLGRLDEALELGRASVKFAEEEDLEPVNLLRMYVALASAETRAGLLVEAARSLDSALRCAEREGVGGVPLGTVYEARARLAIRRQDAAAFEQAQNSCAYCVLSGDNPALTAKHERLLQEARTAGLVHVARHPAPQEAAHPELVRLQAVRDDDARAALVLECLSTHCGADVGWLFGVTKQGAALVASLGDSPADEELRSLVDAYLAAESGDSEMVTVTRQDERAAEGDTTVWTAEGDKVYVPLLLRGRRQAEALISGLAVLRTRPSVRVSVERSLLDALGQALLCNAAISGVPEAG